MHLPARNFLPIMNSKSKSTAQLTCSGGFQIANQGRWKTEATSHCYCSSIHPANTSEDHHHETQQLGG
jgi:hypothetical protein